MSRTRWVKRCSCDVLGCVIGDVRLSTEHKEINVVMIATIDPEPCCPKCHQAWERVK